MCGIGGWFGLVPGAERREALRRALAHRGPDGAGERVMQSGAAALVHTRLAIVDLSAAGAQPMGCDNAGMHGATVKGGGRFWITFNGEIYNHEALRAELEEDGVRFEGRSDTEILLRLFAREGTACLRRLAGMFAIGVWDDEKREGWLARGSFWNQAALLPYEWQDLVLRLRMEGAARQRARRDGRCIRAS